MKLRAAACWIGPREVKATLLKLVGLDFSWLVAEEASFLQPTCRPSQIASCLEYFEQRLLFCSSLFFNYNVLFFRGQPRGGKEEVEMVIPSMWTHSTQSVVVVVVVVAVAVFLCL